MKKCLLSIFALASVGSAANAQFTSIALRDSTSGKVGFHMSVGGLVIPPRDLPSGHSGDAYSGSCKISFSNPAYVGELPPGVALVAGQNRGAIFSGTPKQPGAWSGILSFEVGCTGGSDTMRYSRSIPVRWSIEP